jgi:hypothetical protein
MEKYSLADTFYPKEKNAYTTLLRLLPDGALDRTFPEKIGHVYRMSSEVELDPNFSISDQLNGVKALTLQPDGAIAYSASFSLGRINANGRVEGTFQIPRDLEFAVYNLQAGPDSRIWITGDHTTIDGEGRAGLLRLNDKPVTYSDWQQQCLSGQSERVGPRDSYADDGIPNFVRYAFSLAPSAPWNSPLFINEQGQLHMKIKRAGRGRGFPP